MRADSTTLAPPKAPWHLWVVAALFLLIGLAGALDYLMCLTANAAYFASQHYTATQIAYFTVDYPLVARGVWTVAVACGMAAPVLLLRRSRWAAPVALGFFLAQLALDGVTFGFYERWERLGPKLAALDVVVVSLSFGLFVYARSGVRRGWLR